MNFYRIPQRKCNFIILNRGEKVPLCLPRQVCTIFGIAGACRSDELIKLKVDDVEDKESILIIHISKSKTNRPRTFIVTAEFEGGIKPIELYKRYLALRPSHVDNTRFFLMYRHGKCMIQPVGIHTIGGMPSKIASFLNLHDASLYTGHCFRRTSATLFANAGGSKKNLKHHGGWKSDSVAESYVEELVLNKTKIAKTILGGVCKQQAQSETFTDTEILQNSEMEKNPNTCLIGGHMEKENSLINSETNTSKSFSIVKPSTSGINFNNPSGCSFTFNIYNKQ